MSLWGQGTFSMTGDEDGRENLIIVFFFFLNRLGFKLSE